MDTLELFRHSAHVRHLEAGEEVFRQGDEADFMYVVLKGEVEIVFGDDVVDRLHEGNVFGEMALVDRSPRSATARVSRRCSVALVDREAFSARVAEAPWFALEVLAIVVERLRRHMVVSQALLMTPRDRPAP